MTDKEYEELVTGEVDEFVADDLLVSLGLTRKTTTLKTLETALGKLANDTNPQLPDIENPQ